MKTIFNTKNVDPMSQPLFLGKDLGVQRYDVVKYPVFKKLDSMQMMNFWRPEEIELKKDRGDFKEMTDNDVRKRIYEEQKNQIDQDMAPFGFLDDGINDITGSFVDNQGDRWHSDEYGDRSYMWDYY